MIGTRHQFGIGLVDVRIADPRLGIGIDDCDRHRSRNTDKPEAGGNADLQNLLAGFGLNYHTMTRGRIEAVCSIPSSERSVRDARVACIIALGIYRSAVRNERLRVLVQHQDTDRCTDPDEACAKRAAYNLDVRVIGRANHHVAAG